MINIRPASDLKNKYLEIEELVLKEDEAVYLTKNGYGSMVVLSLEKYADMLKALDDECYLESRFGVANIEEALENSDKNSNKKYYSHDEMKKLARRILDGE